MDVWYSFQHYKGLVYQPLPEDGDYPIVDPLTGQIMQHAVVILGFDDNDSCWICRNSWGSGWGEEFNGGGGAQNEGGYFRIKYGVCHIDNRTMVTGSVTSNTCFAKLIPNFQTFQTATNSSFGGDECAYVLGSASTASNGTIPVGARVQVNSGATLTVASGVSLSFGSGSSLTVNGTLNATSATFDWTGSSNWGGIIFNSGSSGSLSYCNINHGSPGVKCNGVLPSISHCTFNVNSMALWLNGVGSPSTHISANNFYNQNTQGQAISCYYSSPQIDAGTWIENNSMGIFCVGSSPTISYSTLKNNANGLYLLSNSAAAIGGYNRLLSNGSGIYADGSNNVTSYYSDVYTMNPANKAVRATNSAVVIAQGNYWGQYPPNAADFVATNGGIIYYLPGATTPWTGSLPKMSAPANTASNATEVSDPPNFSLDQQLLDAAILLVDGKYDEAIGIYTSEFKSAANVAKKKYVLAQLAECYRAAGKSGFIDFLNTDVRQTLSQDDELCATTLELENLFLIPSRNYQKAIENLITLTTRFARNDITLKDALFNLGYIHAELLTDGAKGKEYFDELKAKYPDDMLTWQSRLLLGEIDSIPASAGLQNLKKEVAAKVPMPTTVALLGNYPNPFNPSTVISYQLPAAGHVSLKVYNMLGQLVATLLDGIQDAGFKSVTFDASHLASGVYFYRLEGLGKVMVSKLLLLR
jgi:tetratricopeptide (TPR) repeat protein